MEYTKGERSVNAYGDGTWYVDTKDCIIASNFKNRADALLDTAAPDMAQSGAELDRAIGEAIIKVAQATKLSNALIQIIQTTVLPAQEKWRKALPKAEGK